jgi:preprotein translocase subunit SecF
LVGSRKIWYAISLAVILAGMGFLAYRWSTTGRPLNYGIDFTGGALTQFAFPRPFGAGADERIGIIEEVRGVAAQLKVEATVEVEGNNIVTVRVPLSEEQNVPFSGELAQSLEQHFGDRYGKPEIVAQDVVGPTIGAELKRNAIYALIVGICLIIMYISYRYDFKFAICAIIALVHDVLVIVSAMAISDMPVNSEFVAVLLTVVGYSVHDTVVIFDRIRENVRLRKMDPFDRVVNDSLLQTMARSVNTVVTVLAVLCFLFFMGGTPIHSFSFALLVGITSGAYSSIFNASQILVSWKGREVSVRQRVSGARMADRGRRAAPAPSATIPTRANRPTEASTASAPDVPTVSESDATTAARRAVRPKKKMGKRRKRF